MEAIQWLTTAYMTIDRKCGGGGDDGGGGGGDGGTEH